MPSTLVPHPKHLPQIGKPTEKQSTITERAKDRGHILKKHLGDRKRKQTKKRHTGSSQANRSGMDIMTKENIKEHTVNSDKEDEDYGKTIRFNYLNISRTATYLCNSFTIKTFHK